MGRRQARTHAISQLDLFLGPLSVVSRGFDITGHAGWTINQGFSEVNHDTLRGSPWRLVTHGPYYHHEAIRMLEPRACIWGFDDVFLNARGQRMSWHC